MRQLNSINLSQGLYVPQFYWLPYNVKSFPIYSLYLLGLYIMAVIISLVFKEQAATIETVWRPILLVRCSGLLALLLVPVTVLLALSVVGMPLAYLIWLCFLLPNSWVMWLLQTLPANIFSGISERGLRNASFSAGYYRLSSATIHISVLSSVGLY